MKLLRSALTVLATGALLAAGLSAPQAQADTTVPPVARVSCVSAKDASITFGRPLVLTEATPTSCRYEDSEVDYGGFVIFVTLGTPEQAREQARAEWPDEYPYSFENSTWDVPALGPGAWGFGDASPPSYIWSLTPGVTGHMILGGFGSSEAGDIKTAKLFRPMMEGYTVDGERTVNGRKWRTKCEMYSSNVARCFTDIWGTTIKKSGDRFVRTDGWVFNSLTYRWAPRASWAGNPLATHNSPGGWTAKDGRKWRTECDTPATGRGACRSYVEATVVSWTGSGYKQETKWIFNNMVLFSN